LKYGEWKNNNSDQADKLWTKSKFDCGDFFLFLTVLNLIQDMKQNAYGTVFYNYNKNV
jgi:hypothetical protein